MMDLRLDYIERTGLHIRVGLVRGDATPPPDAETWEAAAREHAPGLGVCWDVLETSRYTAEVSFEDGGV